MALSTRHLRFQQVVLDGFCWLLGAFWMVLGWFLGDFWMVVGWVLDGFGMLFGSFWMFLMVRFC